MPGWRHETPRKNLKVVTGALPRDARARADAADFVLRQLDGPTFLNKSAVISS